MTPLSLAPVGEPLTVVDVRAGKRLRQRLADMGLTVGTVIQVVPGIGHGPVILSIGDTRLALGRGASHKVIVRPALVGRS
jgi:ferrous iron transport protein A